MCENADDVRQATQTIGKPVVVKAQILVAGRGKAGGVKPASTPDEAYNVANLMLGSVM